LPAAAPTTDLGHRSIVVVIPTYNERENLATLVPAVLALGPGYRIIVVDDNSPDGTGALADELASTYPGRVDVIHRPKKEGLGRAYLAGFHRALAGDADLIAEMDADHSHNPADLPRLVAAAATHDLVLGSRYVPGGRTQGWPLHRQLISRLAGIYARTILGVPIADPTGGFKVFRRATLAALDLAAIDSDGYAFQIETTYRALQDGRTVIQVPITFADRVAGKSKLSRRIIVEAMIVVWKLRLGRRRRDGK
jgi:dolichol-phosphate mannosyltransferase